MYLDLTAVKGEGRAEKWSATSQVDICQSVFLAHFATEKVPWHTASSDPTSCRFENSQDKLPGNPPVTWYFYPWQGEGENISAKPAPANTLYRAYSAGILAPDMYVM